MAKLGLSRDNRPTSCHNKTGSGFKDILSQNKKNYFVEIIVLSNARVSQNSEGKSTHGVYSLVSHFHI